MRQQQEDQLNSLAPQRQLQTNKSRQKKNVKHRGSINRIKNAPLVGGGGVRMNEDEHRTVARIKRGKLTRTWDLRSYPASGSLPSALFSNVEGIQEALVCASQLPFLVQDDCPSAQIELSSLWRLIYGMRELVVLWVFPNEDSDPINEALSAIARQLSLVFNIANQGPAFRRGEKAWRFTLYRRKPSASTWSE